MQIWRQLTSRVYTSRYLSAHQLQAARLKGAEYVSALLTGASAPAWAVVVSELKRRGEQQDPGVARFLHIALLLLSKPLATRKFCCPGARDRRALHLCALPLLCPGREQPGRTNSTAATRQTLLSGASRRRHEAFGSSACHKQPLHNATPHHSDCARTHTRALTVTVALNTPRVQPDPVARPCVLPRALAAAPRRF